MCLSALIKDKEGAGRTGRGGNWGKPTNAAKRQGSFKPVHTARTRRDLPHKHTVYICGSLFLKLAVLFPQACAWHGSSYVSPWLLEACLCLSKRAFLFTHTPSIIIINSPPHTPTPRRAQHIHRLAAHNHAINSVAFHYPSG